MSLEQLQHEQNLEQNTIVCLNDNLNDAEEINKHKLKIRQTINYTKIFNDPDECVNYMLSEESQHIYFLISGSLADTIIPLIYQIEQIKCIYIFCLNKPYHSKLTQKCSKINGIFTELSVLCDTLRQNILTNKTEPSSVYSSSTLLLSALPLATTDRSNKQEAVFMYFRLLTETLVDLKHKQTTKEEFISMCRSQYDGNSTELEKIEEFSCTYSKAHAIRWYTRDSFLYRILNNALRTQDIDILFKLGFFIADLYKELEYLYANQSKSKILPSIVYRGQFMSKNELDDKIRNNIGGFLSINSFFSTSRNKQVALMFTGNSSFNEPNIESVLFEIIIDGQNCRRPIADIKSKSYMEEEDEILFSMASVFRIKSVERLNDEGIWIVHLLMSGEEDEELNTLGESIKAEIGETNTLNTFGGLLMKIGDLEKAECYMQLLLKDTETDNLYTRAMYYSNLSLIYNEQMNFDAAVSWAEKALQISSPNPVELATIYHNLGLSYMHKGKNSEALHYLHKTVDICSYLSPSNKRVLALAYLNLGKLYGQLGDFSRSLEYFFKFIEIHQTSMSNHHPHLALVYGHIGSLYLTQNDHDLALFYLLKCLTIQQRSLPPNHPHLACTYTELGIVYNKQANHVETLKAFQKAWEIISGLPHHVYLPMYAFNLGQAYKRTNNPTEALKYYQKALDFQTTTHSPDYNLIIRIYKEFVLLCIMQENWRKIIDYCQKVIPIALSAEHEDLVFFYNMISSAYMLFDDLNTASHYVELAVDVGRRTLSLDHPYIQQTENLQRTLRIGLEVYAGSTPL